MGTQCPFQALYKELEYHLQICIAFFKLASWTPRGPQSCGPALHGAPIKVPSCFSLASQTPPQHKSRSSWWSGSACGALKLKRAVNQSSSHRNYRVGSWWGVRNSFYENAKRDLIKETHCRKMKKCQFALKQNRSMNILTIWQKLFPYKYIKVAQELEKISTQLSLCLS